jgi:hypothetical protein
MSSYIFCSNYKYTNSYKFIPKKQFTFLLTKILSKLDLFYIKIQYYYINLEVLYRKPQ